jgi:hypothetical protein
MRGATHENKVATGGDAGTGGRAAERHGDVRAN